ncbi:LysR family transcriptional regulator [Kibdelosporangium aridum]|uniref:DNA-binding transcriptional regulator, LysR family n=1 Tax=Kibdelosporangium aridum TaxID=2030 RepID=A0A1W1ZRL5_KIBAR|nr:LysR family transcriptional regulator [Kibdelosporangium aridum]SMC51066.1 DNA-binding transcriptional regulator, LysR family [Kibdelosporangium aridum]
MSDLDLAAIRAFVAVADYKHFGEAAAELGITQQAVSRRIAKLEADFGTVLLSRLRSGTTLSKEGAAFLPHARNLLAIADQTADMLRRKRLPLRVDVLDTRIAATEVLRGFHGTTDVELEIVTSRGLRVARESLKAGTIDAAFARVLGSLDQDGITSVPACFDPVEVLANAGHPLAKRRSVSMAELSEWTIWMPGNVPGSEWADFYEHVAAEFGLRIDTRGPDFGWEDFVHRFTGPTDLLSLVGESCRLPEYPGVVRIPVDPPRPCYLSSLLWHRRKPHSALPKLISYVRHTYQPPRPEDVWLPACDWALISSQRSART